MRDIERRIKALEATAARREAARANIQSVNVCDHIAPVYLPLHADLMDNAHQYYNLPGGRGSAKSSFVSLEIVAGIMQDQTGCSNAIVFRRTANTMRESVFSQIAWAIDTLDVNQYWRGNVSPIDNLGYIYHGVDFGFAADPAVMMRVAYDSKADGLKPIRKELESAIADAFAANPEHLDAATIELLKSGIMSADEYNRLMSKATADNNPTMVRLIAKYAKDRADQADADRNTDAARAFRAVAYKGNGVNGNSYLEAFDVMTSCFNRCMNNTALIGHWDELNGEIVENF